MLEVQDTQNAEYEMDEYISVETLRFCQTSRIPCQSSGVSQFDCLFSIPRALPLTAAAKVPPARRMVSFWNSARMSSNDKCECYAARDLAVHIYIRPHVN